MNPRNILIVSGLVVVVAGATYLSLNNKASSSPESRLLQRFEQLADKINSTDTKKVLFSSCNNQQDFLKKISDLELEFSVLKAERVGLAFQPERTNDGSKPLNLSDGDYSKPGSKPLDLSDGDYSQPGKKSESQPLNLSDGDYSKPGSKPLDLSDGDYEISNSDMGKMYGLEKSIETSLNSLKSLCNEKKVTPTTCQSACQRYSDCAGFTEESTKQDQQDAYDSCMEECSKWSKTTIICINQKTINAPGDCAHLSQCALKEYRQ